MRHWLLVTSLLAVAWLMPVAVLAQNPNTAVFPSGVAADTDLFVAQNDSQSTLSSSALSTDTSVVLVSGSSFTAPAIITIESEVLHCAVKTTNTLSSCTRGQEGTTAAAHASGVTVQGLFTAYMMDQALAEIKALESGANFGGAVIKTSSYAALSTDNHKLIAQSSSSANTLTLPATPPTTTPKWSIDVLNINSGVVDVSRNGLQINGAASDISLSQGQGVHITTDGTNYFATYMGTACGTGLSSSDTAQGRTCNVNSATVVTTTIAQQNDNLYVASTTGSSAYSGSPANGCGSTALKDGIVVWLSVDVSNSSGAATFAFCGLGSSPAIKNPDGTTDPFTNVIPIGVVFPVTYKSSVWTLPDWVAYGTAPESGIVGTGGVTANTLVITDASAPSKFVASTGTGSYGVALATVSAGGTVRVQRNGKAWLVADNTVTAGDIIIPGSTIVIRGKDSGQTSSGSIAITTRIVGTALTSASAGSLFVVELTPAHFGTQLSEIFVVGSSIASASTIAPTTGIVHITGTAAVSTITPPTNFAQAGWGGCLRLIPDGAFTTTTGGNIAIVSTAVVSKILEMCFDNATTKWYPSY